MKVIKLAIGGRRQMMSKSGNEIPCEYILRLKSSSSWFKLTKNDHSR